MPYYTRHCYNAVLSYHNGCKEFRVAYIHVLHKSFTDNYTALHYTALRYTDLHQTAVHHISWHCTTLHCIALHWYALPCIGMHCMRTALQQNTLHSINTAPLHYIILRVPYSTLHCVGVTLRPFRFIPLDFMPYHTISYRAIPHHTRPQHAMPHHTNTHTHPTAALAKHFSIRVYRGPSNKLE